MLTLTSSGLSVLLLDPRADEERLGSRYCSGGYIWQVTDDQHGELLSGPCFPAASPPPFDGQGLPEVFEIALGQHRARLGDDVWVIGVGRVRRESPVRPFHVRDNPTVVERSVWSVEATATHAKMRSCESFGAFELGLERSISLTGRTLASATALVNRGTAALPVRWFAHPFFPWAGAECCRFSLETELAPNPGFFANERGFLERRSDHTWTAGCYATVHAALGGELEVTQKHPKLAEVRATCRFPLAWLAIWGNDRTVSFEPFFATLLEPGAEARWGMEYAF